MSIHVQLALNLPRVEHQQRPENIPANSRLHEAKKHPETTTKNRWRQYTLAFKADRSWYKFYKIPSSD